MIKGKRFEIFDIQRASKDLAKTIYSYAKEVGKDASQINIVCVGTDRSTGDCVGPLVGTFLSQKRIAPNIRLYGSLHNPVHAKNIPEIFAEIDTDYLTIAVDACLGEVENIGTVTASIKPLKPGAGAGKSLPEIGDITIVGTVAQKNNELWNIILQNVRLSLVYDQANVIAGGLALFLSNAHKLPAIEKEEIAI